MAFSTAYGLGRAMLPFRAAAARTVPVGVRQKQRVVRQLIEGRLSLMEAIERFRQIHQRNTVVLERSLGCQTAPTDTEGLGRAVIGWVANELHDRPDLEDDISRRLESELLDVLAQNN